MKITEIRESACCPPSGKAVKPLAAHCCPPAEAVISIEPGVLSDLPDEPCCGPPPSPRSSIHEKPGYAICRFVEGFMNTPAGFVPKVSTNHSFSDVVGTFSARSGLGRNNYKVAPGLYASGNPDESAPVLVTANYKLTFDKVRTRLKNIDAWILVIDTRGINVWCAGGKSLFSSEEVVRLVQQSGLSRVVSNRKLILPQLAANGVSARLVKQGCGFEVVWGPVRAEDIGQFLQNRMKADPRMRLVTFGTLERLVLIPVELNFVWKPLFLVAMAALVLSGIGPGVFSAGDAVGRGGMLIAAVIVGIFTGAVLTPVLLPWIPVRAFSLKGVLAGLAGLVPLIFLFRGRVGELEVFTLLFVGLAVSSYLAMNFTGSTPYTAPSGVEKEMKISIPIQAAAVAAGIFLWIAAAFQG